MKPKPLSVIARALGAAPVELDQPIAVAEGGHLAIPINPRIVDIDQETGRTTEDSAFPLTPEEVQVIVEELGEEEAIKPAAADTSSPEEEEALRALDAKLNAPPPRHEEWHVTVDGDPIKWWKFLSEHDDGNAYYGVDVKPLYIELANFTTQLMCSMIFDPRASIMDSKSFVETCEDNGFQVTRIKHEVSALRPGEVALYYEGHVKLDGPFRTDRHGASRDLYRRDRWYRTQRTIEPFDVATWIDHVRSQSKPSQMAGFEFEACLVDTNPSLDARWL